MAWEYLDELDYRYKQAVEYIEDNDFVVDVNSGNSRLRNYVTNYLSNDLYNENADYQITDQDFIPLIEQCDVLCLFGIGGYEITNEPLESSTVTDTVIELAKKHKPRILILECIDDFTEIAHKILKKTGYKPIRTHHNMVELQLEAPEFVRSRTMYICRNHSTKHTKI